MGALFRELKKQGHTQKRIGVALDIDQTYVSQIAKAPDGIPRGIGAEMIRRALDEYHVNPWYFFDFPREKIPEIARYIIDRHPPPPHPASDERTHTRKKAP